MIRGLNAFVGILLFLTGGVGSFVTWCVAGPAGWDANGFTVLLAVGAAMVAVDLWVERNREERRREPVSRIDTDPWGRL